ncbi:MAG: tRNA (adenosine(37)-N6)-threonylcarbamoyltransferase complex dimerization subunit type 1 TsaB [Dehalococcoidia bacterium]|nr:tRNA (adenosine(37)-N6)-threonylcarbamoyltransferase complex dimerization subunit type 1 TsaB [Dehalococcoidia bacterium]MDZ4247076.1 tRNA (adenosine(37)-N6)-threonylcarbamoyltransferase complex dimerization subunit type 1 TsaB [Dehalococcoidia bacterium]
MVKNLNLAIDSSTNFASIALAEEDRIIAELTWRCGKNQTVELVPAIRQVLELAGTTRESLGSVIVARGPGSYNGLRAGISVAKSLAYALQIPVTSVGTLELEAYQHAAMKLPIQPLMDAGRGEIVTAVFSGGTGDWKQIKEEYTTTIESLCRSIRRRTVFCGDMAAYADELKKALGERAVLPVPPAQIRRSGYLAALGWQKLQKGLLDRPDTLQPVYFRKPQITQPKSKMKISGEKSCVP